MKAILRDRTRQLENLEVEIQELRSRNQDLAARLNRAGEESGESLRGKLMNAELEIGRQDSEIRKLHAQIRTLAHKEDYPEPRPQFPVRRRGNRGHGGCPIDVSALRRRFDRLEDAIDDLQTTLGK
jgi:DNA repair exonuclease SbcCD ATPase subunit